MSRVELRWVPSALQHTLATVVLAGLATAAVLHSAIGVAIVAPELLWLAYFAHPPLPREVVARADCWPRQCSEHDQVSLLLDVTVPSQNVELHAQCHGPGARLATATSDAAVHRWRWLMPASPWGRRPAGRGALRLTSRSALWEARLNITWPEIEILPITGDLRETTRSTRVRPWAGSRPARATGEGIEAVGVSPYAPGMPVRRVNWRRTLQRDAWYLTDFAAERSQDVVVVVDATVEAGPPGESTVDRAVRGAAAISSAHIAAGDRVGLVTISPALAWVVPGLGRRHLTRLLQTMIMLRDRDSVVTPDLDRLPPAAVPRGSLVVVLSPLLSEQSVAVVGDLRRRGHPVQLVEVSPGDPTIDDGRLGRLVARLWRLERRAMLLALQDRGVRLLTWPVASELAPVGAEKLRGGRPEVVA